MTIKQVELPKSQPETKPEEKRQEPLLNITLPAPASGNPNAPLPIGQHNAAAQKNFEQVAKVMMAIVNNQKLMSMAINELNKEVKKQNNNNKKIANKIRELLEKKENEPKRT